MRQRFLRAYYDLVESLIKPQVAAFISPNIISLLALILSLVTGVMYGMGLFFAGGIVLLLSGFLDTIDGTIARLNKATTQFGALLDSVLDRYADFFILTGLLIYYRYEWVFFVILLAMLGSFMVSYVKARSESIGKIKIVGLMQRPERVLLVAAGTLLTWPVSHYYPNYCDVPVVTALCILAILTNITSIHRLFSAKKNFTI